jgi:HTH-type transcriptional regulator / antitoxin HigA
MATITVRVIKEEADYEALLQRIDEIFDAKPGTPEGYELEVLLLLADHYKKKNRPLPKVSPVEVIKFVMHQKGLMQKDIAHYLGGKNRTSEVMRGQRQLTARMIKKLSAGLNIPVEALI